MIGESSVQKIVADHITWQPKRGEAPVLKDICLTLCAGEFYGILGPNGAGKTSLARQILKLQKSGEGSVRFPPDFLFAAGISGGYRIYGI